MLLFLTCFLAACSGFLFYPQKKWQLAEEVNDYEHQVLNIAMPDGILLNALLMPHRGETLKGAVLFFHGNDGNVSVYARHVFWLTDYGYDVVLVDYRGYGLSQDDVNLRKNISDIAEVSDWFVQRYDEHVPKFMLAHSLGASMAGFVFATRADVRQHFNGIVLDAGFADYRRMMREVLGRNWLLGLFRYPAALAMPDDYDLIDVVDQIAPTPLLIMHGRADPVVPYQHGVDLYNKARAPKTLLSYDGYHMDAFDNTTRRLWLLEFFASQARGKATSW